MEPEKPFPLIPVLLRCSILLVGFPLNATLFVKLLKCVQQCPQDSTSRACYLVKLCLNISDLLLLCQQAMWLPALLWEQGNLSWVRCRILNFGNEFSFLVCAWTLICTMHLQAKMKRSQADDGPIFRVESVKKWLTACWGSCFGAALLLAAVPDQTRDSCADATLLSFGSVKCVLIALLCYWTPLVLGCVLGGYLPNYRYLRRMLRLTTGEVQSEEFKPWNFNTNNLLVLGALQSALWFPHFFLLTAKTNRYELISVQPLAQAVPDLIIVVCTIRPLFYFFENPADHKCLLTAHFSVIFCFTVAVYKTVLTTGFKKTKPEED